ncbi:DUF6415 family natural product biosynthesis protein [Streptomyces sp. STR69]|uniref:DUF6415 family natural product biosynthesis protein n=1 Tax=Streptomyces sp. STR69 TaxID=1796942 RepID=UPI0021CAC0A8|nr:DUF6415 family natural product biosynthesis protein [Streptomyces sp. STR69]
MVNAAGVEGKTASVDTEKLRASAKSFLNSHQTLPRYETVQHAAHVFYGDLCRLIPEVEKLAERCDKDDVRGQVALVAAEEARRRSTEIERSGLTREFERVQRLARLVVALCDHYETLAGTAMCLVCDRPLGADEDTMPYDRVSPSGNSTRSGRIHSLCAEAVRRD